MPMMEPIPAAAQRLRSTSAWRPARKERAAHAHAVRLVGKMRQGLSCTEAERGQIWKVENRSIGLHIPALVPRRSILNLGISADAYRNRQIIQIDQVDGDVVDAANVRHVEREVLYVNRSGTIRP